MVRFTNTSTVGSAFADPDVRLMLRVRSGDTAAFEELYRRYQERVYGVITYLMGNRQYSEDLTQDVFLRVYRARESYVVGAKFSTWLFTIVNNVVLNARRSLGRRREVHVGFDDPDHGPGESPWREAGDESPVRAAQHNELRQLVQRGILQLGVRQRAAVSLCDLDGLSYADVADKLGTTADAAKSLIHRGRMSLRKSLERQVCRGDIL